MKLIFNKKQLKLKIEILNTFINAELARLAIEYMKLKMADPNRKQNELIIKRLDFLLELTEREINIEKFANINLLDGQEDENSEQIKAEFFQIQEIFQVNNYYEKVFKSFLFYVGFLVDRDLQDKIFYEIYHELEVSILNKFSQKIDKKIKKVTEHNKMEEEIDSIRYLYHYKFFGEQNFSFLYNR